MTPPPTTPGRRHRFRLPRLLRIPIPLILLAHPFELAVAFLLGVSVLNVTLRPAAVETVLPGPLLLAWVALGALGVAAMVGGLLWRHKALGRAVEKAGLYLLAGTMLAYALVFAVRLPPALSWPVSSQLTAIGLAAIFRAVAIRRTERIVLEQLRKASPDVVRQLVDGRPPVGPR